VELVELLVEVELLEELVELLLEEVVPLELELLVLDEELELVVVLELPLIEPAETVRVTRSSLAPSSRLTILRV
jgi:hypothetical protein